MEAEAQGPLSNNSSKVLPALDKEYRCKVRQNLVLRLHHLLKWPTKTDLKPWNALRSDASGYSIASVDTVKTPNKERVRDQRPDLLIVKPWVKPKKLNQMA